MEQVSEQHPADTTAQPDDTAGEARVVQVDPRELLVDANIRTDDRLTKEFVADIRERGVRVPIVATRTNDGALRVRLGHRRTLAAIEAGRPTVPVLVEADDGSGEVGRIVDQFAENEHRVGLSSAERVGVVEQLTAFGVTPAQITKRLRVLKRDQVDAALAVAGSALAKAAAGRYDLTLEQAAALAEFDGDDETVKALVVAAKDSPGRFAHVLQRARDDRNEQARQHAAREAVAASGVTVLEGPAPWRGTDGSSQRLADLVDSDGQRIDPVAHAGCPGHAAHLEARYDYWTDEQAATVLLADSPDTERSQAFYGGEGDGEGDLDASNDGEGDHDGPAVRWQGRYAAAYVCTDYRAHGHVSRWDGPSNRSGVPSGEAEAAERAEAARAQRRVTIDNNKAWRSAETVRREFLAAFLTRKTPPKGAAGWLARALAHGHHDYTRAAGEGHRLACELFGVEPREDYYTATPDGLLGLLDGVTDARAQVVTLGLVLAAYEAGTSTNSWRTFDPGTGLYLRFLADHGYTLTDVERLACGDPASEAGGEG